MVCEIKICIQCVHGWANWKREKGISCATTIVNMRAHDLKNILKEVISFVHTFSITCKAFL